MQFAPSRCPRAECPSRSQPSFRWARKGHFRRRCDGRSVQRFRCLHCERTFSIQTFRLDYRLKKPTLHLRLFGLFVSKVTHRQSARVLNCSRRTIAHRLRLLGGHCKDFHQTTLARAAARGGIHGVFQLDELETYETSRRLAPVTVPLLIERHSRCVIHVETAPLPARGRLSARDHARKQKRETCFGRRFSGSTRAVLSTLTQLRAVHDEDSSVVVQTDCKTSYVSALSKTFGVRLRHQRTSSKERRNSKNPLFPVNHTFAMLRDGISRLVRRSWAASKKRERLEWHLWIWIAYRNYVRTITNKLTRTTPAMALGIVQRRLRREQLLAWRAMPKATRYGQRCGPDSLRVLG